MDVCQNSCIRTRMRTWLLYNLHTYRLFILEPLAYAGSFAGTTTSLINIAGNLSIVFREAILSGLQVIMTSLYTDLTKGAMAMHAQYAYDRPLYSSVTLKPICPA